MSEIKNPFPKLTAEVRRHPENKALLDELGAYLTSVATHVPIKDRKKYDFYEYIGENAQEVFGVSPEKLLDEMRKKDKTS